VTAVAEFSCDLISFRIFPFIRHRSTPSAAPSTASDDFATRAATYFSRAATSAGSAGMLSRSSNDATVFIKI
jgi:hypothetical protein